ncbi:MAG: tandem-95 repeat protein, partial [Ilumatobacter sp.]|nr:tandem-95 repeat protein [Ilumatobacter sp.]
FPLTNNDSISWGTSAIRGGTYTNNGTTDFTSTIEFGGTFTNTVTGTIVQSGLSSSVTLNSDVATAVTNHGLWDIQNNADVFEVGSGANPTFTNTSTGTLRKSGGTSFSSFGSTVDVSSTGLVESLSGTLDIQDGDGVPQVSAAGVLSAGTWRAANGATLDVGEASSPTDIVEIGAGAAVELSGVGATMVSLAALDTVTGSFTVTDGAAFTTSGNLTTTGDLIVGPASDVNVTGDFTENSTNSLHIQIADVSSSGDFGQVNVTGTANLLGVIDIDLVGGFAPVPADFYDIIFYGSRNGTFATQNLTSFFSAQFLADRMRLNEAQNTPPVLDLIASQSGDEETPIQFTATASDADIGDTLTFSLEGTVPIGAGIDGVSGAFTWTPTEDQGPDVVNVTVRVTDDGTPNLFDEQVVQITVNEVNLAPTLDPIGNQSGDELTPITFTANASDPDVPANSLTYSLVAPPAGAFINATTGDFTWTPTEAQGPGTVNVTVRVTDDGSPNLFTEETIEITVNEVNATPVANAGLNQNVSIGQPVTLDGSASFDSDDPPQTLTYAWLMTTAPAGSTATLAGETTESPTFTPDVAGTYTVRLIVNDGIVDSGPDFVQIFATDGTPVIDPIANQNVDELDTLAFTVTATDPDAGDTLTFSLTGSPPAGAEIDAVTGAFTWTPTEPQGPNAYAITVRVTDDSPGALFDEDTFLVTVAEVNVAPTLDPIPNQSVDELALLTVPTTAGDTDLPSQTLTFSLTSGPSGAVVSPTTGVVSWTPTEGQGPGVYTITVRVTDDGPGNLFAEQSFDVTVNELNEPPVLAPIGDQSGDEGSLITFTATASDPDVPADGLTFSLSGPPVPGATIDPVTGVFEWTPTEDQGPDTYDVTVVVTDDGSPNLGDQETIQITVNEVNEAPVLVAIANQPGDEETLISVDAEATDADLPANALTFNLDVAPAGMTIDPSTGLIEWTPTEAQGPGVFDVTVRVTDDGTPALFDTESFQLTVNEVNIAPTARAGPDQTVEVSDLVTLDGSGSSDADIPAQTLTFSWQITSAPAGSAATLSGADTVAPTFTPDVAGAYIVELIVNDGVVDSAPDTVTVTVSAAPNQPPVLDPIANQSGDEETLINVDADATDPDVGDVLTFSLDVAPAGMTIDPSTGLIEWTPTEAQGPDVVDVTVRVTDDGTPNLFDTESFQITVNEVNVAPTADAGPDQTVEVSDLVTLDGSGSSDTDIPAQTLTFSWQITSAPAGSAATLNGADTVAPTFTPDVAGAYTVELIVNDGIVDSAPDTVTVTATPTDPPPTAIDDTYAVAEGTGERILDVLANDSDPAGQPLTI